jgi:hypothetical protein
MEQLGVKSNKNPSRLLLGSSVSFILELYLKVERPFLVVLNDKGGQLII